MKRIIFHIDVNAAYLSWEAVYRLAHRGEKVDLRTIASAVGGDVSARRGIILAKSIPAKRYGIKTGETLLEARRKCPDLVIVPPDYGLYEKCSAAFMDILRDYSDAVEPYSIDEAYIDMSASCHLFGTPEEAAAQIRDRIREELGFTVNVGVSANKLLAKMASDFRKPDQVHTLYPEEIPEKMWPLPVSELFFVGRATAGKLLSMGIRTIGELAACDPAWLKRVLKKHGEVIWGFANGIDPSPVAASGGSYTIKPGAPADAGAGLSVGAPSGGNKGYGNSATTPYDVMDAQTAKQTLLALSETVAGRLRADGVQIGVVSVGIRYADFSYASHQRTLCGPTDRTMEIYEAACGLFLELWNGRPVRHLGVHTGRVSRENYRQLRMFDDVNDEKLSRMDRAVDEIRGRFGAGAVRRAVFLDQQIDIKTEP